MFTVNPKLENVQLLHVELFVHRNLGIMTHFKMDHDASMELMMELIQTICPTDYQIYWDYPSSVSTQLDIFHCFKQSEILDLAYNCLTLVRVGLGCPSTCGDIRYILVDSWKLVAKHTIFFDYHVLLTGFRLQMLNRFWVIWRISLVTAGSITALVSLEAARAAGWRPRRCACSCSTYRSWVRSTWVELSTNLREVFTVS